MTRNHPHLSPLGAILFTLVNAAIAFAGYRAKVPARPRQEKLTTTRLEIVNDKGEVCAVLSGDDQLGGSLKIMHPGMRHAAGKEPLLAYIGCPLPGLATMYLRDSIDGEAQAGISIEGEFPDVSLRGSSRNGSFQVHAGRQRVGDAVLEVKSGPDVVLRK